MSIYSGNKKVSAIYRGSTPITKVYRGTIQVFPDGGVPDPDDDSNYNVICDYVGDANNITSDTAVELILDETVYLKPVVVGKNRYKLSDFYNKEITEMQFLFSRLWQKNTKPFENLIFQNVDVSKVITAGNIVGNDFPENVTMRNLNFESFVRTNGYSLFNAWDATDKRKLTLTLENVKFPVINNIDITNFNIFSGNSFKEIYMKNVTFGPNFNFHYMFGTANWTEDTPPSKLVADKYIMDAINNDSNKGGLGDLWNTIEKYYYDAMGNEQPYV